MFKTLLSFVCFLATVFSLSAQQLPNADFVNPITSQCSYDGSTYGGFVEWMAFQTTDSNYWGPRDTHCIAIATPPTTELRMGMGTVNPIWPVYIQSQLDSLNKVPLDSNTLYKFSTSINVSGAPLLATLGTACPDGVCSGMQIGIEIPDSTGMGTEIRWYPVSATTYGPNNSMDIEFCFSTERFPTGNFIRHAYLKISPNGNNAGVNLLDYGVQLENMNFFTEKVTQVDAPFNGSSYEHRFGPWINPNCYMCSNTLMMYTAPTHPGPNHLSYVEVFPSPNQPTPQTVDVVIDFSATLNFQPFTQLRGGLVLGDTLRHSVNLINNGGTVCTYAFIDLIFQDGDNYTHRAGQVKFEGDHACMQFGKGSTLRVAADAHLDYGRPGHGMLALRTSGQIVLEKGATMVIGNTLAIGEYRTETAPGKFEVHLKPGSKLVFGPASKLTNGLSRFPDETKLDVYMEGGTLEDEHLSAEERALIRRIYAQPSQEFAENLKLLGNPISDALELTFVSRGRMDVKLEVLGVDGTLKLHSENRTEEGVNYFQMKTTDLPSGAYFLRLTTPYATAVRRVVKL